MEVSKLMAEVKSWASDVDENTRLQAERLSRLSVVSGHVALMPDAHLGIGATVGSVIPTENAIVPSAVGVDLGCGMIAVRTSLEADNLPDTPLTSEVWSVPEVIVLQARAWRDREPA